MVKRNTEPSIATLECICRGMGMSLPQFLDVDNQMGLTPEQRHLIHQWSKLNNRNKRLVDELVEALNEKTIVYLSAYHLSETGGSEDDL